MSTECGCSSEFGPCEAHGEAVVVREGASLRTADELALCLVDDLVGLGAELSPWGQEVRDLAAEALSASTGPCAWLEDEDLRDDLHDLANQVDCSTDYIVVRDDGYVIYQVGEDYWAMVEGWAYAPAMDR